ncbi:hypothetical protein [Algoriphagus pacificus]|uniref:YD repeat-containing protein n=1 Tax=Algoriphagus pacificus TaxID=2811234 RepID=A0ABS3CK17_9BACT|nr:hypothetical protein [Algoriphagus pacificus]MBN7817463.1 hypothetical protein [Algoriphagus pacificus]
MKFKFYVFLVVAFLNSKWLIAQSFAPIVAPASPDAASLTKYSDFPNATYSGIPDISIPLYGYSGPSLNYNLGLSYFAQGFKVQEEASAIGLGWSLDATAVITRELRSLDDLSTQGFYKNNPANYDPGEGLDAAPDIFKYNILGSSGRFVLDYDPASPGNYKVVILNKAPFKIELINSNFKVTDESGLIFNFNTKENTRREIKLNSGNPQITNYISSWFLTSMISPIGDQISFQYASNPRKIVNEYVSSTAIQYTSVSGPYPCNTIPNDQIYNTIVKTVTDQLLLSLITLPNGSITFQTSTRVDLNYEGSNLPLKYSKIIISSNALEYYKEIEFKQFYFNSGSGSADKLSKRLKLQSIYEKSNTDIVSSYDFDYDNVNLPDKNSNSKDYWGFYNGQPNTTIFGNREPNPSYAKANLLKSIRYPTGGKTIYTFESNNYVNFNSSLMDENPPNSSYGGKIGPGCRIAKIENFDHSNNSLGFKEYKYLNGYRMTGSRYNQNASDLVYNPTCGQLITYNYTMKMSESNFATGIGAGGYEIGYGSVSEVYENQGDNGKKEFVFYNVADVTAEIPGVPKFIENKNGYLQILLLLKKNGTGYKSVEEHYYNVNLTNPTVVTANVNLPNYVGSGFESKTFPINSNWKYIDEGKHYYFDENGVQKTIKLEKFYYDNASHMQLTRKSVAKSNNETEWSFYQYPFDYSTGNTSLTLLKNNHILNLVVEEVKAISNGSTYRIIGGTSYEFKSDGKGLKDKMYQLEISSPILSSAFKFSSRATGSVFPAGPVGNYSRDSRFKSKLVYNTYTNNRLVNYIKNGFEVSSLHWGYNNEYPILFVANANLSNVGYTSFESASDNLNWSYSESNTITGPSKTGKKHYNLGSAALTKSGYGGSSTNVFKLTFWAKRTASGPTSWNILGSSVALSDTEWRLVQRDITTNSFTLSGSGVLIDELRLHPKGSSFNTYTYQPLLGVLSYTDSKNKTFYYEYDSWGRLISVKDDLGYLIDVVEYEYMFGN